MKAIFAVLHHIVKNASQTDREALKFALDDYHTRYNRTWLELNRIPFTRELLSTLFDALKETK